MSGRTPPREWNAGTYHVVATPHLDWGAEVIARLELSGKETVLDAGCGTGRVTRMLLERLPRGRVLAVDASEAMVRRAREELGARATVWRCDLLELSLDDPVDAVVSTATFHWIADHEALFGRIHAALRRGGQFVAQCGGTGNTAGVAAVLDQVGVEEPFAPFVGGWRGPWNFVGPEETAVRLEAAGFEGVECWLQEWPVAPQRPREFMETVILGAHLDRLPKPLHAQYIDRVSAAMPDPPVLDYVRLNLVARRPER